jgi:putative ABC transport system permease protein
MSAFSFIRSAVAVLFQRSRVEAEVDAELRVHIEDRAHDLECSGISHAEAQRQARLEFGGYQKFKEECREALGAHFVETLLQDIRYGLRMLRKSPGFTVVAVLTLALGIGANTAIFSLIDAILLRDLPVRNPSQLLEVMPANRTGDNAGMSLPMLEDFKKRQQVFSSMFGWWGGGLVNVEFAGAKLRPDLWAVDGEFYSELGAAPFLGRFIVPGDVNLYSGEPVQVAVLGYDFWRSQLGGNPSVIGKTIRIEDVPFEIIGVARQDFTGLRIDTQPAITIPITAEPLVYGGPLDRVYDLSFALLDVTARLKEGISFSQANAQLQALWSSIQREMVPSGYSPFQRQEFLSHSLVVKSAAKGFTPLHKRFVEPLYILMAISGLVLIIACVNLASLFVSRAAARGHEISIRVALGASRSRLVRQLLTESMMLSVAGAAAGFALAHWSSKALAQFILRQLSFLPGRLNLSPDWHVLAFTAGVAVLTGTLFGLAPVVNVTRSDAADSLQESARIGKAVRSGSLLVCTQIALSLVLLMGAALLIRSLINLRSVDPGFESAGVLDVSLFENTRAPKDFNAPAYYRGLLAQIDHLPGVISAGISENVPASNFENKVPVIAEPAGAGSQSFQADLQFFSPGAFRTLGMRLEQGRDFRWSDDDHAPAVAVLSETLARRLFPTGDAIGQRIAAGPENFPFKQRNLQVIGLVSDANFWSIRAGHTSELYIPTLQSYAQYGELLVRTNVSPLSLVASMRQAVESMGREFVLEVRPLSEQVSRSLLQERVTAMFSEFFGGLALLLASVGLYGLMSYSVTRRTREIGIRMALGAQRQKVLWMILRETVALILTGIAIGTPFALLATRLIANQLFGLSPRDPLTLTIAGLALLAVGALAGYVPSRRAMDVDPMVALRYE